MLEGKEIQGEIGQYGGYFVDLNMKGQVEVGVSIKIDLVAELEKLAQKTNTPIDDHAIAWVKKMVAVVG